MKVKTITQAEAALKRLAEIDAAMTKADVTASEAIAAAKSRAEEETRDIATERDKILLALEAFASDNRDELFADGKKSAALVNGELGFRRTPDKVVVSADTADLLEEAGFGHCVKVTREPVKASLKNFSQDWLDKLHVRIEPGQDKFFANAKVPAVPDKSA